MKTHHNFEVDNASNALPLLLGNILADGEEVGSRQGERTLEILMPRITLWKPWQREILAYGRRASLPAQIAETMWVLAGRNDVEWLSHYLPRAAEFSDDGKTWRGAYGPRLRAWDPGDKIHPGTSTYDQLQYVVRLLTEERGTRRAVMSIYDPAVDTHPGKDIPCNDFITFISRLGKLHMTVTTRSNDVIWGWSGINQFEWSALQEIVAKLTGNQVGTLTFNITSLHLYERHWDKARKIVSQSNDPFPDVVDSPRFDPEHATVDGLDGLIAMWFEAERAIREDYGWRNLAIEDFPEPMMRSWLQVINWYWRGQRNELLYPVAGTRLEHAARFSPKGQNLVDVVNRATEVIGAIPPTLEGLFKTVQVPGMSIDGVSVEDYVDSRGKEQPLAWTAEFVKYVDNLHREKSAVYGDSWKKRGEQTSILANIARKIDRLGVEGAGDSAADTVIDLLVYLAKYRLWINNEMGTHEGVPPEAENDAVAAILDTEDRSLPKVIQRASLDHRFTGIRTYFEELVTLVGREPHGKSTLKAWVDRAAWVDQMIRLAFPAARLLWGEENGHLIKPGQAAELFTTPLAEAAAKARRAVVQEANKGRRWEGYEVGENID